MTNQNQTQSVNRGFGLASTLTALFVVLKLNPGGYLTSPVVDWSWWLVFSPVLVAWGIAILIIVVLLLVWAITTALDSMVRRRTLRSKNRNRFI